MSDRVRRARSVTRVTARVLTNVTIHGEGSQRNQQSQYVVFAARTLPNDDGPNQSQQTSTASKRVSSFGTLETRSKGVGFQSKPRSETNSSGITEKDYQVAHTVPSCRKSFLFDSYHRHLPCAH
eukprot:scaffold17616_cov92-Amphora_coffeaeformis.AAC.1